MASRVRRDGGQGASRIEAAAAAAAAAAGDPSTHTEYPRTRQRITEDGNDQCTLDLDVKTTSKDEGDRVERTRGDHDPSQTIQTRTKETLTHQTSRRESPV